MQAAQVHNFISLGGEQGDVDSMVSIIEDAPKPTIKKPKTMLVKVLACSLSPGDMIVAQGNMIIMHPTFPYVPGMDICGTVVDCNNSSLFNNGDVVVASNGMDPKGGLAEYMVINEAEAVIKPKSVSAEEAASSSSAITSHNAVMDHVKEGYRVLILGGSGGVGSAAIQIAKKHAGASFIATTSTQKDLCKELGADQVIDYREEDWWTVEEFKVNKFDVIIDTVGGGNYYDRADKVLKTGKQGGYFVAVTGDDPKPDCRSYWKLLKFFGGMLGRSLYTSINKRTLPNHVSLMPYDEAKGRKKCLEWMADGSLKIKLDESSPLPFTANGVRQAFVKVASGHAHGKVVVKIAVE